MWFLTEFSAHWKEASIILAGAAAVVSILLEIRDKQTKRLTGWGRIFLGITIIVALGALFAQVLENAETQARNAKSQEQTLQLLTQTRQSILELSRILQSLDQPKITLYLDLNCGPPMYEAFCQSAQTQANAAMSAHQNFFSQLPPGWIVSTLGPGSVFSGGENFDWSKWPQTSGPVVFIYLQFFRTTKQFEEYANCVICAGGADLTAFALLTGKTVSPLFTIKSDGDAWVQFVAKVEHAQIRAQTTAIMSIPDLQGAVVSLYDPQPSFQVLTPRTISIDTARGQRVTGKFQIRELNGKKLFFAEFPSK